MIEKMTEVEDNLFLPIPLFTLRNKLRKKHFALRPLADALIDSYVKSNGEGFERVNTLLMRKMESLESISDFTDEDEKNLAVELKEIDSRFKPVLEVLTDMDWNEQKELYLDHYDNLVDIVNRLMEGILPGLIEKEGLTEIDYSISTYLRYFVPVLEGLVELLGTSKKGDFDKKLLTVNAFVMVYGPIISSYSQGRLKKDLLNKKLSELATFTMPAYRKVTGKVRIALELVKDVAPMV